MVKDGVAFLVPSKAAVRGGGDLSYQAGRRRVALQRRRRYFDGQGVGCV